MKKILTFLALALTASAASCSPAEAATPDQLEHAHQVIFNQGNPATSDVLFRYAGSMSADAAMMTVFDIVSVDNQVQRWQECPTAGGGRLLKGFNATGFLLVRGEVAKAKDGWQALLPAPDGHQCAPGSRADEWPSYNYLVSHPGPNVKHLDVLDRLAIDFYDAANLNDYASVMMMYEALLHAGFRADYWFACSTKDNGVLLTAYTTAGKPMISGQVTMGGKLAPSAWHAIAPVSTVCGHGPTLQAGWYDRHHFSKDDPSR